MRESIVNIITIGELRPISRRAEASHESKNCSNAGCCGLDSLGIFATSHAQAAIESRDILKTYFETGDVPTADQFSTFIDSYIHKTDDGLTLIGVEADTSHGDLRMGKQGANLIGINLADFVSPDTHPPVAPDWAGSSGSVGLEYVDTSGELHFGFVEMSMDAVSSPPLSTGPAINVESWSWETDANKPIFAPAVPEPASMA